MTCEYCGGLIPPKRAARNQKILTCSTMCSKNREASLRMATAASHLGLKRSVVGPLAEMMVTVDLMRRGYYVFRAVGPHCPCDLIVLHDDHHLRVEVRTAYKGRTGTIHASREKKADIWAGVMMKENEIVYEPPLETFFGETPLPDIPRSVEKATRTKEIHARSQRTIQNKENAVRSIRRSLDRKYLQQDKEDS